MGIIPDRAGEGRKGRRLRRRELRTNAPSGNANPGCRSSSSGRIFFAVAVTSGFKRRHNGFMRRPSSPLLFAALALSAIHATAQTAAPTPTPTQDPTGFARPLPGITEAEKDAFAAGSADFNTVETPETGLGPIYNNVSCLSCHNVPALGGSSVTTVTRFGETAGGVFNPLKSLDGSLLHSKAIAPILQEAVPPQANTTALRITPALYGDGLIEEIPDATIIANSQLPKPAGIGGRVAIITDVATGETRVGRFGWKAQHATLLGISGDALNNEIGITNRLYPKAAAPDGNEALLAEFVSPTAPIEDQPNPITGLSEIDRLANYIRFLGPPPPGPASTAAAAGQQLFASLGCISCHTPSMNTGPNPVAALSNQTANLYSDLLLHDMGSLNDGIAQADAGPNEMKTPPLWGVRAKSAFLHDGRAATLDAAILDHAGEAQAASTAYSKLRLAERQDLIAFLRTL